MIKRIFDIAISSILILFFAVPLLPLLYLIYRQDKRSPFYISPRVGLKGKLFQMVKLRTMVVHADKTGVDSTSSNDPRITPLGHLIRRYKLDEIPQLINVFLGQMSFVGPRPNVKRETDIYTLEEKRMLTIRPGITDFASIVFSDESAILKDYLDPDLAYNQVIRPWKSRLALFYVERGGFCLDLWILSLTALSLVSRKTTLKCVSHLLRLLGADEALFRIALRTSSLMPLPPPGASKIVTTRHPPATIFT